MKRRRKGGGGERQQRWGEGRAPLAEADGEALSIPCHPCPHTHTQTFTDTQTYTLPHSLTHSRAQLLPDLIDTADVLRLFLEQQHVWGSRERWREAPWVRGSPVPHPRPGTASATLSNNPTQEHRSHKVPHTLPQPGSISPLPHCPGRHSQVDNTQRDHCIHSSPSQIHGRDRAPPTLSPRRRSAPRHGSLSPHN